MSIDLTAAPPGTVLPAVALPPSAAPAAPAAPPAELPADAPSPVSLTRTASGWTVVSPAGAECAADLVEGMCLADLVVEELGGSTDPDRTARRSARGSRPAPAPEDPREARLAALERTVAQLEHALAARVSTERAIGVLVERHGIGPREAFDGLRQAARSQGRPVTELARELLDGLPDRVAAPAAGAEADVPAESAPVPDPRSASAAVDGRS